MEYISDLTKRVNEFVERNGTAATEKLLLEWFSLLMIASAFILIIGLFILKQRISYGRYAKESILGKV